jgi:hypothetical protein
MSLEYFIGAGDVKVAKLDTNFSPLAFRDVGEAPVFEFDPTVGFADNWATGKVGPNLQDLHLAIKTEALVHLTLKERTLKNLELELFGESSSENAGNYTGNEAFASGLANGDVGLIPGGHVGISTLVIKDSVGATVTSTKYTVNPDAPLVTFLDVSGHTQPFKAFSYSYSSASILTILSKTTPEMCVLFDGINLAVPGERIWSRIDRISFGPAAKVTLKSGSNAGTGAEVGMYELTGPALVVPGKTGYGELRKY